MSCNHENVIKICWEADGNAFVGRDKDGKEYNCSFSGLAFCKNCGQILEGGGSAYSNEEDEE